MPRSFRFATALIIILYASVRGVHAQDSTQFDLPSQPLAESLKAVGLQTKVNVLLRPSLVDGRQAPAIKAELTTREALAQLLAGTGLEYQFVNEQTVVIREKGEEVASKSSTSPEFSAETSEASKDKKEGRERPLVLAQAGQNQPQGQSRSSASNAPSEASADKPYEEVLVTGTHIRGIDGPSPVQTYSRRQIEETGAATTAEFFRKLPQNFSSAVPETANFVPTAVNVGNQDFGFANGVNLRGMGADSTLILLNGRRLATSGGSGGAIVDISTIPIAAIDRVEVLTDGASAIYGADAIGGVVNVILRRQFEGGQATARYGNDTKTGNTPEGLYSLMGGFGTGSARLMAGVDYLDKEPLYFADRDLTRSNDKSPFGGRDLRSAFGASPGNVRAVDNFLDALNRATSLTNQVAIPAGQDGTGLTIGQFNPAAPANLGPDFQSAALSPGERRKSAFASGDYWVSDHLRLFAEGLFSDRTLQFNSSAPLSTGLRVPATNPFNPFGEDVLVSYSFFREFPRGIPFARMNRAALATLGGGGTFPSLPRGLDWSWELALTTASDKFEGNIAQFTTANANAALAITDPARTLNVFGDQGRNDPDTLASFFRHFVVRGRNRTNTAFLKLDGDLFPMPAGRAKAAIGVEVREEESAFLTELTGNRFDGEREIRAGFAELLLPLVKRGRLLERVDLTVAGRAEEYSDFGEANSPKVGLVIASRRAMFRGSWGRSFKAPLLREVTNTGALITTALTDTNAPGGPRPVSVPVLSGAGNQRLSPEKAEILSVGGAVNLVASDRTRISAETYYFDIAFRDRIVNLSSTLIFGLERQGVLPAGVVNRDAAGNLLSLSLSPLNFSRLDVTGVDARLSASQKTPFGSVSLLLSGTRYGDYRSQVLPGQPVLDVLGKIGWPVKWSANATLGWALHRWTANVALHGSAAYLNDLDPVVPGTPDRIPGWSTVDVNGGYEIPDGASPLSGIRIGAGVSNLLDEDPPFVQGLLGFDPSRTTIRGRSYHLHVSKSF